MSPKRKVAVLVASHHPILLEGMKMILGSDPRVLVVGEVQNLWETPKKVRQLHPDVLLLDIPDRYPHTLATIRHAKEAHRKLRILALTLSGALTPAGLYRKAGVSMFIHRGTTLKELLQMIHAPTRASKPHRGPGRRTPERVHKSHIKTFPLKGRVTA